jgi:hypothetical protein
MERIEHGRADLRKIPQEFQFCDNLILDGGG